MRPADRQSKPAPPARTAVSLDGVATILRHRSPRTTAVS